MKIKVGDTSVPIDTSEILTELKDDILKLIISQIEKKIGSLPQPVDVSDEIKTLQDGLNETRTTVNELGDRVEKELVEKLNKVIEETELKIKALKPEEVSWLDKILF